MKRNTIGINVLVCFICIYSCSSENENKCPKEGKVIAYDMRDCMCCGGWLVEYNNDTLLFDSVPDNIKLMEVATAYGFPIHINFDIADSNRCIHMISTMTCIEITGHNQCESSGEILGYDYTKCGCCPGWIIKTNNDTIKALTLPLEQEVNQKVEKSGFPVKIKFSYEEADGSCNSFYKKITCMEIPD